MFADSNTQIKKQNTLMRDFKVLGYGYGLSGLTYRCIKCYGITPWDT